MKRAIWAAIVAVMLALPAAASAVAAPTDDTVDYTPLFAFWDQYGVDKATQTRLLDELQDGKTWDAMRLPGSAAASSKTTTKNSVETTVLTYADGSIAVTTVDDPSSKPTSSGGVSPASVSSCSYSGGSYWYSYTDCKASESIGIVSMWFYFDYSGSYNDSSINDYWGASATCMGCTVSDKQLKKKSSTRIDYTMDVSIPIAGSTTVGMRLTIKAKDATTTKF